MRFSELEVSNWRQFGSVSIYFHPRVTILTGANGAGKSTILRILSQHFGWSTPLLGTPRLTLAGALQYWYRRERDERTETKPIGHIRYDNEITAHLNVPLMGGVAYNVSIASQQHVEGLYIGSHRPVLNYQQVTTIPTNSISAEQAYQQYYNETFQRYNNNYTQFSPTYRMKEAIISMATFGPGNKNLAPNPDLEKVFDEFEDVLRVVLPSTMGFKKLMVQIPDVILITSTGEFLIDASSGGIMSLIDLTWQIFLYSRGKNRYTVVLDEPENHLHPSMQRTIIQSLVSAFPQAQFIIATHSPFVVSSVRDASVYVLQYSSENERGESRVNSVPLAKFSRAGTASDILRDALGVPVTMPIWAEQELKNITSDLNVSNLTEDGIAMLRSRLEYAGLEEFYPEALSQVARRA